MTEMFSFSNIKLLLKVDQELKFELVSKRKLKCYFFSLENTKYSTLSFDRTDKKAPMADIAHFLSSS